jgi:hypothetical protein
VIDISPSLRVYLLSHFSEVYKTPGSSNP